MDGKKIVLLAGALIIAVVAAFLARSQFSNAGAPQVAAAAVPNQADMPHILVATKALPVGTILDAQSFRFQPWPKELMEQAYYLKGQVNPASLAGAVVRTTIAAGQPMVQGALIKPGERGFLAAALGPGMRAITVPVQQQTSVAGFIFPGDRVDLVLTQSVPGGGDGPPLKTSETILRNIRVLATDQRTDALGPDGKPVVLPYSNVTIEVTPKIAEKVAVALTVGSLSLSLRSIADNSTELEAALASGTVDASQADTPDGARKLMAQIAARPGDGASTFSTGADVSRYQRSSVPGKPEDRYNRMSGMMPGGAFPGGAVRPAGPMVRVARGNQVTEVPVGGTK